MLNLQTFSWLTGVAILAPGVLPVLEVGPMLGRPVDASLVLRGDR